MIGQADLNEASYDQLLALFALKDVPPNQRPAMIQIGRANYNAQALSPEDFTDPRLAQMIQFRGQQRTIANANPENDEAALLAQITQTPPANVVPPASRGSFPTSGKDPHPRDNPPITSANSSLPSVDQAKIDAMSMGQHQIPAQPITSANSSLPSVDQAKIDAMSMGQHQNPNAIKEGTVFQINGKGIKYTYRDGKWRIEGGRAAQNQEEISAAYQQGSNPPTQGSGQQNIRPAGTTPGHQNPPTAPTAPAAQPASRGSFPTSGNAPHPRDAHKTPVIGDAVSGGTAATGDATGGAVQKQGPVSFASIKANNPNSAPREDPKGPFQIKRNDGVVVSFTPSGKPGMYYYSNSDNSKGGDPNWKPPSQETPQGGEELPPMPPEYAFREYNDAKDALKKYDGKNSLTPEEQAEVAALQKKIRNLEELYPGLKGEGASDDIKNANGDIETPTGGSPDTSSGGGTSTPPKPKAPSNRNWVRVDDAGILGAGIANLFGRNSLVNKLYTGSDEDIKNINGALNGRHSY